MPTFAIKIVKMKLIATAIIFLLTTLASCSKDDNEMPEITVVGIQISPEGNSSVDNLLVGDTVFVFLNLQSNKKDLNSFSCKLEGVGAFHLAISKIDPATTNYVGSDHTTSPDEDCTVTFRDGTTSVDLTVEAVVKDHRATSPQLRLFLFSEKETAQSDITFTMSSALPDNAFDGVVH